MPPYRRTSGPGTACHLPDVNPALVDVVLPDPELQREDGRLRLRHRLLVGDGVPPQVRPPAPVAHRLQSKERKGGNHHLQRSKKWLVRGLVKFVPAVAYLL